MKFDDYFKKGIWTFHKTINRGKSSEILYVYLTIILHLRRLWNNFMSETDYNG